jgi:tetratricopeptide (TPR) repeat protein
MKVPAPPIAVMKMRKLFAVGLLGLFPALASAQDPAEVRRLFEAGQYQQAVEVTTPEAPPPALYTAAQSHQKLGATDQALEMYGRLAALPEGDPWRFIGVSAQQLLQEQVDAAAESAQQAVNANGDLPEAHYQRGLVEAKRQNWHEAAAAFDRAVELDPSFAYAHYYGGLMHYRAKQPDIMAIRFEHFLRLAPNAPERPEVMQIMKTVRGR